MDLNNYFSVVDETALWLKKKAPVKPKICVILSGGLEAFLGLLENKIEIYSADIPNFPVTRVEGHAGKLVFGNLKGVPLVVMAGRYHYYEGHLPQSIVFPYFVFGKLGVEITMTTNAVGGVNRAFKPGDIMIVEDHINMMGINPLIGLAVLRDTNQFTDMTNAYDKNLRILAKKVAVRLKINIKSGVYVAASGPSYETKAEIRAFRKMGADAVGMSTVPEVIAMNFIGMKVLSLACIANPAADLHKGGMAHSEVLDSMKSMSAKVIRLIEGVIEEL